MAFAFDTTVGGAAATSYVTVVEADDYYEIDRVFAASWAALTATDKQYRLAWASRILDQRVIWKGTKATALQGMDWPRIGTFDNEGVVIQQSEIPVQLKHAVLEFVKYTTTNDPTVDRGVDYVRRITLDVLEIEYQEGTSQSSYPPILNSLLRSIGKYPTPGGASFAPISKA